MPGYAQRTPSTAPVTAETASLAGPLGLSPAQTDLYLLLLRLRRADLAELATALRRPAEELRLELAALIDLGLLEHDAGEYAARHPGEALGRLVTERLDRIAAESRRLGELMNSARALADRYDAGRDPETGELSITRLRGAEELSRSIFTLTLHGPPAELACAVPDIRAMDDFARIQAAMWIDAQSRGRLRITAVIPADSLAVPQVRERVSDLVAAGGRVRTLHRVPSWFFTLDDRAAGLPAEWGTGLPENGYTCYLVRSPLVVAVLRALFAELWRHAVPVPAPGRVDVTRQVLRLASQGLGDDSIARHLGVSVRTVRSRFAEAMSELGVQSRFQAGVEVARRGWLG